MGKNFGGGLATTMPSLASFVRPGLLALLLPAALLAQGWVQRTTLSSPPARNSSPAAYDVYRGVTTLFGGYAGTNTPLGDTWEYNGVTWAPRITPLAPAARWGHGMAFDQRRGCVVLFGGYDGSVMRNDTWEWNGFGWTPRPLPSAPPARGYFGMSYDAARGVVVAFGGVGTGLVMLGDTWEYDGSAWTQRSTATAPSPRRGIAFAWDETRRETLLFGGGDGSQLYGDLWAWNGTTWSQKAATGPAARQEGYFAFDGNCGRAVLFGGADQTFATNYNDSWQWDGVSWTQLAGSQPPARHGAAMVHDAQRGQIVVHGGRDGVAFRTDTWELAPSCSRTMAVVAPPVVGQTAQFRYDYPAAAGNLHFCWTLVTPRQPTAFALPIPGLPTIGLCRVDLFNQLLSPATFLDGSGSLATAIPIPANTAFNGFQFDVQNVDLDLFTLALRWADNDAEVTTAAFPAPVASFTATPTSGTAPLVVQFTDTSTNFPTSWQWDFNNDGTVDSTAQNPSWPYLQNGLYSVRLVAGNLAGSGTMTRTNLVFVGLVGPTAPNPQLNMAPVAPGTFQMGSTAGNSFEQPVHQVTLSTPFWMGKYEVTQAEYQAVMGNNPSYFQGANAPNALQRPVETVSWNNAVAYCQALTATEQAAGRIPQGYQYRLPTEAEWEYCCRAGTTTEWHTGTSLGTSQANFAGGLANSSYPNGQTAAVGSYPPNAFGLHDMHGNVWEWCLDLVAQYGPSPAINPFATSGPARVIRGGGYYSITSDPCRSAYRNGTTGNAYETLGFRVVLAPVLVPNTALNMARIDSGTFHMGSNAGNANEQPVHQVSLASPFWIGKYEVTQAEYQAVMGINPSYFQGPSTPNAPQRPVEQVSWNDAIAYCQALTAVEQVAGRLPAGYQYRLPTEAEWEYCCRAGTTTEWSTGTSLSTSQANFAGTLASSTYPLGQTAAVGSYAANAFSLTDMHGNVWEWCLDSYAPYVSGASTNPFVNGGTDRVFRGGGFGYAAIECRSANRLNAFAAPNFTSNVVGFRVVLAPILVP